MKFRHIIDAPGHILPELALKPDREVDAVERPDGCYDVTLRVNDSERSFVAARGAWGVLREWLDGGMFSFENNRVLTLRRTLTIPFVREPHEPIEVADGGDPLRLNADGTLTPPPPRADDLIWGRLRPPRPLAMLDETLDRQAALPLQVFIADAMRHMMVTGLVPKDFYQLRTAVTPARAARLDAEERHLRLGLATVHDVRKERGLAVIRHNGDVIGWASAVSADQPQLYADPPYGRRLSLPVMDDLMPPRGALYAATRDAMTKHYQAIERLLSHAVLGLPAGYPMPPATEGEKLAAFFARSQHDGHVPTPWAPEAPEDRGHHLWCRYVDKDPTMTREEQRVARLITPSEMDVPVSVLMARYAGGAHRLPMVIIDPGDE